MRYRHQRGDGVVFRVRTKRLGTQTNVFDRASMDDLAVGFVGRGEAGLRDWERS
jgi:hypothetical protein